jgi:hypothetical protein
MLQQCKEKTDHDAVQKSGTNRLAGIRVGGNHQVCSNIATAPMNEEISADNNTQERT